MHLLGLLSIVVQIALGVHAIRTGRELYWITILIIPVVGPAVYIITQLLPELASAPKVRRTRSGIAAALDPQRELRARKAELERADTLDNRRLLAAECVEAGFFDEASELYRSCLEGEYRFDEDLLLGLARAQFGSDDLAGCKATLDRLLEHHPDIVSQSGHLLYARCQEGLGHLDAAEREYSRLVDYATGEEARMRYARLLHAQGRSDECRALCEETLRRAFQGGKAYRRMQGEWIREAESMLGAGAEPAPRRAARQSPPGQS